MKDLKDLTLDDISVPEKTQQPQEPVAPATETPQPVNETTPAMKEEPAQEAPSSDAPQEERAAFDFAEKTGGAYEDFDSIWNEFQQLKESSTKAPEGPTLKDDFIKDVVDYYEKTGDLTPYLEAKLVDYDKMTDEDIVRRQLREENPTLSEKAFSRLYEKEMSKYNLDPDEYDPEDVELQREILKGKAQKLRETWKEKQEQFKAPEPTNEPSEEERALAEKYNRAIQSDDFVQQATKDGKFDIKVGEESYTYEVEDTDTLSKALHDDTTIFQGMWKDDGNFDFQKYLMTVEFAKDPKKFIERVAAFGKSVGADKVLDDLENPTEIKTPNRETSVPGSGDWKDRFFEAAKQSKRYIK